MPGIARGLICHVAPPARLGNDREEGATSRRGPDFLEISSSLSPIIVFVPWPYSLGPQSTKD
jgi:hypothetical protein